MKRRFTILILAALSAFLVVFASGCAISTWWDQQNCKHKYNDGVVTVDATCAEEGERVYTCSKCGKEKKEAIATLPHTNFTVQGQAATCLEGGYTDYVICTTCKDIVVEKRDIPALGHLETVVKGYAETCLSDGLTDGKKCARCQIELIGQQVIPCKGHVVVSVGQKASTCTEAGYTSGVKCEKCGKIYSGCEALALLEHEPWKDGLCSMCGVLIGYTYSEEIGETYLNTVEVTKEDGYFTQGYYRIVHSESPNFSFTVTANEPPPNVTSLGCDFGTGSGELLIYIILGKFNQETGMTEDNYFQKTFTAGNYFKYQSTGEYTDIYIAQDEITLMIDGQEVTFKIKIEASGMVSQDVMKILKVI